jgi:hypothetical protein
MVLKALQSVVGKQMCSKIIAKKKSVVDLDETVTMCIIRLIPDENADMMIKEYYELFNRKHIVRCDTTTVTLFIEPIPFNFPFIHS